MNTDLYPSVWRTFRVLANPVRLRALQLLHRQAPLAVSVVSRKQRLSASQATQVLRALQARGLLRARRRGAWVLYAPDANPSIAYAPALAAAMRAALSAAGSDLRPVVADMTAFTHERRIGIVRALAGGADTRARLRAACRICPQALGRHLDKLFRRGVVAADAEGRLHLPPPRTPLAAALLTLALGDRPPTG